MVTGRQTFSRNTWVRKWPGGWGNVENVLRNRNTNREAEAPSKTLGGCKVNKLHQGWRENSPKASGEGGTDSGSRGVPGKAMAWYTCGAKAGTGRHQGTGTHLPLSLYLPPPCRSPLCTPAHWKPHWCRLQQERKEEGRIWMDSFKDQLK